MNINIVVKGTVAVVFLVSSVMLAYGAETKLILYCGSAKVQCGVNCILKENVCCETYDCPPGSLCKGNGGCEKDSDHSPVSPVLNTYIREKGMEYKEILGQPIQVEYGNTRDDAVARLNTHRNWLYYLNILCKDLLGDGWRGVGGTEQLANPDAHRYREGNQEDINNCIGYKYCGTASVSGVCKRRISDDDLDKALDNIENGTPPISTTTQEQQENAERKRREMARKVQEMANNKYEELVEDHGQGAAADPQNTPGVVGNPCLGLPGRWGRQRIKDFDGDITIQTLDCSQGRMTLTLSHEIKKSDQVNETVRWSAADVNRRGLTVRPQTNGVATIWKVTLMTTGNNVERLLTGAVRKNERRSFVEVGFSSRGDADAFVKMWHSP